MDNKELFEAMRSLLEPINNRLDSIERGQAAMQGDMQSLKADMSDVKDRLVRVEITQENIVIPQIRTIAETHGDVIKGFRRLDAMNEKIEDIQNTVEVLKLVVKKNNP